MSKNDTAAAVADSVLTGRVAEISKQLREQKLLTTTIEGDTAKVTADKDTFKKLISLSGKTEADFKDMEQFKNDFFTAVTHEVAVEGEATVKKHKSIDTVSLDKLNVGRDKIRVTYRRQAEGQAGIGANATPVTHFGDVQARYSSAVGSTSAASYVRVRDHFRSQGASLFGPKK